VTSRSLALLLAICPLTYVAAEDLIPIGEGTTWNYTMTQERPNESFDLTEPNKTERFDVVYRMGGTQNIDSHELHKLEIHRGDRVENIDLISVDERGIICTARANEKGAIKVTPAQTMLKMPLETGTNWNFEGTIGETKVSQHYQIAGDEEVEVPAGKFHAWRIHCEQTAPNTATIDRWFVPGTGFVKVETTVKGVSGGILQRTSLQLKKAPEIEVAAEPKETEKPETLSVGVSSKPKGEFKSTFSLDTPAIYARWHGDKLRPHAEVRAVWIAANVADVTADYTIDEASTVAPASKSGGTFTLERPEGGWASGNYRVEFYLDDALVKRVELRIGK
jgi:hypothetical protein